MKKTTKLILMLLLLVMALLLMGCSEKPKNLNYTGKSTEDQSEQPIVKESTALNVVRSHSTEDGTYLGQVSNRELIINPNTFNKAVSPTTIPSTSIKTFMFKKNNIDYRIFVMGNGSEEAALVVVNETKEQLEIELLKLQIKQLTK